MDEDEEITQVCKEAVGRLAEALPGREVGCLLRSGDTLRHVAQSGRLRFIFEVPDELGGVTWRAVGERATQVVPDVASDSDYIASDDGVRAEIAVPVTVGDHVVAVLDVEHRERLEEGDAPRVEREAARLARDLARIYAS